MADYAEPAEWQWIEGGVTAVPGVRGAGVRCGIKKEGRDLALILCEPPVTCAGVFTTNRVKAAPVLYDLELLSRGGAVGVVANSGNANACTGAQGLEDARRVAEACERALDLPPLSLLVASTGVIGVPLPVAQVTARAGELVAALSDKGGSEAAEAIMTTDTFPKALALRYEEGAREVRIGGMAKGAGMICPHMATMLAFLTANVKADAGLLQELLQNAVGRSFNRITVDGEMSTNDTVLAFALGGEGNMGVSAVDGSAVRFERALEVVCRQLAHMIVQDGEGASRFVEIVVSGAQSEEEAVRAGKRVANSLLCKSAFYGGDPNWGRILAALGASDVQWNADHVSVRIGDVLVAKGGRYVEDAWEVAAASRMSGRRQQIGIDLAAGPASATVWTCDLTEEYVRVNAAYRT